MKKLLLGLIAGISAGLLFAPKSGKKLREQLKNSDERFVDFGNALLDATKDAGSEVKDLLESDEIKDMLTSGKKSVEDFANVIEEKGSELSKRAQKELDTLVEDAIDTAKKAKTNVKKKAKIIKKKAGVIKKTAIKKATTVKKRITKKAPVAKKSSKK